METEGRVGAHGEGAERRSGRGARRRLPGFGRGPGRPSTCALCIVRRERRGEGRARAWAVGVGRGGGLPRGRGLADTAAGVPARAVGNPEHRRDLLAEGEGAQAETQGGRPL